MGYWPSEKGNNYCSMISSGNRSTAAVACVAVGCLASLGDAAGAVGSSAESAMTVGQGGSVGSPFGGHFAGDSRG